MEKLNLFFRNDDPDTFEFGDKREELRALTQLFFEDDIPLVQAVVPKTVTPETVDYFLSLKQKKPTSIEIVQHGYCHQKYIRSEFDESRNYGQQRNDINQGRLLMEEKFGKHFFHAFVFPFGGYTKDSLKILDELNYRVLSCFWKNTLKHKIVYKLLHLFNQGPFLKYHISYHGRKYGNYKFYEYSNCINVIKSINPVIYFSAEELFDKVKTAGRQTNLVGIVLHYNTLEKENGPKNLDKLSLFIKMIKEKGWIKFSTLGDIYRSRAM